MKKLLGGLTIAVMLAFSATVMAVEDCSVENLRWLFQVGGWESEYAYYWNSCTDWWSQLQFQYAAYSTGLSIEQVVFNYLQSIGAIPTGG